MEYRRSLDGMRGVAVTAVVVYHIGFYLRHQIDPGGWAGVDVFFVLSGFLITRILLTELRREGRLDLRDFYYRRVIRLAPALLLLLLALSCVALARIPNRALDFTEIVLALGYVMNWSRALSWFPGTGGFLGHTWSLSVEEQFYLVWPVALLLLVRARRWGPLIVAVLAAASVLWRVHLIAHGAHPMRTSNGSDTHADPILIGCLLAFVFDDAQRYAGLAARTAILPMAVLAVVTLRMHLFSPIGQSAGVTIAALCSAWIVLGTFAEGWLGRALSARPLVYTGRISYGWYLWHYPVLFLANEAHRLPAAVNVALMAGTYGIAAASFHFVERPISVRFKSMLRRAHGHEVALARP
jgi:peptidoglycan/LPS O-acetylase OafA/YrhL